MKTKQLLLLFLLFINLFLFSQDQNDMFYSRYEGVVDSNIQVTANIVRLKSNLTGNYNYYKPASEINGGYIDNIALTGTVSDNEYSLKEYGNDDLILKGSIDKSLLSGSWYSENSGMISINVSEYYPLGSIPFDVYYLHSEDKLIKDKSDSPVAEIELTLIYPLLNNSGNGSIDSVRQYIAIGFFGNNFYDDSPDSMLTHFENEYYNNYISQNASRYESGASFNWQKIVTTSVINNSDFLLCIEFLKYAYSGGAHGMTNISYQNIDLNNGNSLAYNDVFIDDTTGLLSELLTKQLYIDKEIPLDISLTKAGYFVDSIGPNHNIFINNAGIGFLYNSYEIAPYSFGQTSVFLNYEKIMHLLKKGTPVYKMIK